MNLLLDHEVDWFRKIPSFPCTRRLVLSFVHIVSETGAGDIQACWDKRSQEFQYD